jgi:putative spermidine/putrescine transport system permease protein
LNERFDHVRPLRRIWLYVFGALALFFLVLPTLIVIPMSFTPTRVLSFPPQGFSLRWYHAFFLAQDWQDATRISLLAATLTSLIATTLGTLTAYVLSCTQVPFARLVRLLTAAPMIVPAILLAIGCFYVFAVLGLNKTLVGLVIAHTMLAIPLVVITVSAGFQNFDLRQEMVARSLGAPRWKAFATVTLPQIKLSILSAALFAFVVSLDEAVISLFVGGGNAPTLPRRMFTALRDEIEPTIAAVSTLLIIVSIILVAITQWLGRAEK